MLCRRKESSGRKVNLHDILEQDEEVFLSSEMSKLQPTAI